MVYHDDPEKGLSTVSVAPVQPLSRLSTASTGSTEKAERRTGCKKDQCECDLRFFQELVGIQFLRCGGGLLRRKPTGKEQVTNMFRRKDKGTGGNTKSGGESHDDPELENPVTSIFGSAKSQFRNRGLYERAVNEYWSNAVLCSLSYYIITCLYLLQILLAATLTAISAYQDSLQHTLTGLGAANTVVAGILAWLTGQGMPIRFRRARDRYRCVVKEIEMAERMFATHAYIKDKDPKKPKRDPMSERDRLEALFEAARIDQESNYPEVHYDHSANEKDSSHKQQSAHDAEALAKKAEDKKDKWQRVFNGLETLNDLKDDLKAIQKLKGDSADDK